MNLLFARFVMLMVMTVLIAVAALGQRDSLASATAPDGGRDADCAAVLVQVAESAGHEPARAAPRRAIRWQSFLPGTFR